MTHSLAVLLTALLFGGMTLYSFGFALVHYAAGAFGRRDPAPSLPLVLRVRRGHCGFGCTAYRYSSL